MAKNFYECATSGGKVVSKKTKSGTVIKICYDKNGKSHVKHNKHKDKINRRPVDASKESLNRLVAHFKLQNNK